MLIINLKTKIMREIKFRAWDKSEMIYNVAVQNSLAFSHGEHLTTENGEPQYILMQFTGLFDKKQNEIYEGDILEFKNDLGRHKLHKIFYKSGGLCFNIHDDDFYKSPNEIDFYEACADMQSKVWIIQCEIIGNIHENPELL